MTQHTHTHHTLPRWRLGAGIAPKIYILPPKKCAALQRHQGLDINAYSLSSSYKKMSELRVLSDLALPSAPAGASPTWCTLQMLRHNTITQFLAGYTQVGRDIDGEAAGDRSGDVSLSKDGKVVAIGALFNEGKNGPMSGHVRVYSLDGYEWVQRGGDIDGEAENDYSGNTLSLSADGSVVAIGAPYNDGNGEDSGHVQRPGLAWQRHRREGW